MVRTRVAVALHSAGSDPKPSQNRNIRPCHLKTARYRLFSRAKVEKRNNKNDGRLTKSKCYISVIRNKSNNSFITVCQTMTDPGNPSYDENWNNDYKS